MTGGWVNGCCLVMAGWWVLEHVTWGRTKVSATVTPRSRDVLPTANEEALHGASCSGSSGAEGRGGEAGFYGRESNCGDTGQEAERKKAGTRGGPCVCHLKLQDH